MWSCLLSSQNQETKWEEEEIRWQKSIVVYDESNQEEPFEYDVFLICFLWADGWFFWEGWFEISYIIVSKEKKQQSPIYIFLRSYSKNLSHLKKQKSLVILVAFDTDLCDKLFLSSIQKQMPMSTLSCEKDMYAFAHKIYAGWHRRIALDWPLWSGKTVFVKWFIDALWGDIKQVKSPTFTFYNTYDIWDWSQVFHGDFYRIDHEQQLFSTGIFDNLLTYHYTLVERPKFSHLYVDDERLCITITPSDTTKRELTR